jgi:hypothetical protein
MQKSVGRLSGDEWTVFYTRHHFAPVRLAALVAQHSEARLLTPAVSAAARLATFSDEETAVTAALMMPR